MNKISFATLIVAITWLFMNSCQNEDQINKLTKREIEDGWQLLFDGKTTNGWRLFKGEQGTGWKVTNGVLCNTGIGSDHGGDIVTKESFENFELYLEWKIDSVSNSGVFYHVKEFDQISAIYETGPEYQLRDGKNAPDSIGNNQLSGACYGMYAPNNVKLASLGEWNKTRIIVDKPNVEHWLNGVKVVEYELWSQDWEKHKNNGKWKNYKYYGLSQVGRIGLQDHGGLTCFRNIKIRVL